MSETGFRHSFPAICGNQAGREFYVAMCPMRLIPRIFVFDDEEIVYLAGCASISRTIQAWIKGGSSNEFRVMIATVDLGVSPKSAMARVKTSSISKRVDKIALRLKFRVIPVPPTLLESLACAFVAIADPRYNGQTTLANLAIDALPK